MSRSWSDAEIEELKELWEIHGGGFRKIGTIMGRTRGSIDGKSRTLGLQFRGHRANSLDHKAPAAVRGTTTFPSRVVPPDHNVLKSGDNQRKLGRAVTKGAWKGFPIFSLTLEERATCPRTCQQWLSCYGIGMGHAKRYEYGPALERQLSIELAFLQRRFPRGFVVRLHVLGDFMSLAYVEFWGEALALYPALHVFGYTARLPGTPIGDAVARLRDARWDRFAVRTSGAASGPRTAVITTDHQTPKSAVLCPAQTGATRCCGTCALCWSPAARERTIIFQQH